MPLTAELAALRAARQESDRPLFVGFNRRHAPLAIELRDQVTVPGHPIELLYRVSADRLPPEHWLNDIDEGGVSCSATGCHFVDFACWFMRRVAARVTCVVAEQPGEPLAAAQRFTITLQFDDSSLATIVYDSEGATTLGKEYVEVHTAGRSGVLEDFRRLTLHLGGRPTKERSRGRTRRTWPRSSTCARFLPASRGPTRSTTSTRWRSRWRRCCRRNGEGSPARRDVPNG